MDIQTKITKIQHNTEEILTKEDFTQAFNEGRKLNHYIGFEISGFVHLGTGLVCMSKLKDFQDINAKTSIFLADWHTWINDKLGGDQELIKKVAKGYFKEALNASIECVKGDPEKVNYVLGSELYHNNNEYWETVVDISKNTNLARILRSTTIMGRKEGESIDFAKLIYPPMQVADIFIQDINIAHAGLDQRTAQVLARDVALKLKKPLTHNKEPIKPIAVHGHLILGLQEPPGWPLAGEKLKAALSEMKMSKSIPNSAVFIHDTPEEIRAKLSKAFCPIGNIEYNPPLDWTKTFFHLLPKEGFTVERPTKFGGNITYANYQSVEKDFLANKLHPLDLKKSLAEHLIKILEPARKHFAKPKIQKMKEELAAAKVTR